MWRLFNRDQLALDLDDAPPKNAEELRDRLRRIGLGTKYLVRLTTNRTVVVSYSGGELRHRAQSEEIANQPAPGN